MMTRKEMYSKIKSTVCFDGKSSAEMFRLLYNKPYTNGTNQQLAEHITNMEVATNAKKCIKNAAKDVAGSNFKKGDLIPKVNKSMSVDQFLKDLGLASQIGSNKLPKKVKVEKTDEGKKYTYNKGGNIEVSLTLEGDYKELPKTLNKLLESRSKLSTWSALANFAFNMLKKRK